MVRAVAVGAEHAVLGDPAAGLAKEGVDVFPGDFPGLSHLENPARRSLADYRVAVGLSLCAADVIAEKGNVRGALVFPANLVGLRVHLDNPGAAGAPPVAAVVEQHHPSVFQVGGVVLVIDLARPPLPPELAAGLVHDAHSAGLPVTNQQVALRRDVQGILVRPLLTAFQGTDNVLLYFQELPRLPLIDHLARRGNFPHYVAPHLYRVVVGDKPALHLGGQLGGYRRPEQGQGIAVEEPLKVVVQVHIRGTVLPDHVAVPV